MVDEFTYPERVQAALDFVEAETKAEQRREIEARRRETEARRANWERDARRGESRARSAQAQREAASDAKFWETRRKQQAAQQAKRRFQPVQPEGWTR